MPQMPEADYHALPALSSGGAHLLATQCPAAYWAVSPFNPHRLPAKESTEFDIGTAIHLAILEPDALFARICLIPADNYRTAAAQTQRDAARAEGRVPLLPKHLDVIEAVRAAIAQHPIAASLFHPSGLFEHTLTWTEDGVPCKARIDYLRETPLGIIRVDLKSMGGSVHPAAVSRRCWETGAVQQADWYDTGIEKSGFGLRPIQSMICAVSQEAPYLVTVGEWSARALQWGAMLNRRARDVFLRCATAGVWPGWDEIVRLEVPSFAEYELEERSARGDFSPEGSEVTA